jgi:UDP-N-acetylglucosamine--N-acetylmuramyl-(pentapeptide) pyrophosphoryl-undecaprenol N-acetylglucosamine transferase
LTTVLIMAGGTGGHVYPALAVAGALRERGVRVVWLGTRSGLEARVVPATGIDIEWLDIKGFIGTSLRRKLVMPGMLIRALFQALVVIRRRVPDLVLGMGGFAAGPGGVAAWLTRRPLIIHEANAVCGFTNRLLAPLARQVLSGFEGTAYLGRDALWTGNPVRPKISALAPPAERGLGQGARLHLLVLGGSQGAHALNEVLPGALSQATHEPLPEIVHQCGVGQADEVYKAYCEHGIKATVVEFIEDIDAAYANTDLVIARAGAMTVSELCVAGLPAILLPYPYAAGDHQRANAALLVRCGAAVVVEAANMNETHMAAQIDRLMRDRSQLLQMANNARRLAQPDATAKVVEQCLENARA